MRYLVTWCQNNTPVHRGFLDSCKAWCNERQAELLVIPGRYKNPTSIYADADSEWWDDRVVPYLLPSRKALCKRLVVHGGMSIQPTASRPLTGFEVFVGESSAIFGHPKRAMEVVPSGDRNPRVLWTTGACTVANYTKSKAGEKGRAHHAIGGLVVEVAKDGRFFCRHVAAESSGAFVDLDRRYTPQGVQAAPRATCITLGDYHAGQEDEAVLDATEALVGLLKPRHVVLHDVLDFETGSPHRLTRTDRYENRNRKVSLDVSKALNALGVVSNWGDHKVTVVRSNHDEFLERWLERCDPSTDPTNALYYHRLWAKRLDYYDAHGEWPNLFELQAKEFGFKTRFLKRDESFMLQGVEHGFHGDKGISGARGNTAAYAKVGVKVTKGHDHTPTIRDGVYSAGVTARIAQGWNHLPATWLNAHVVQYHNGKRAIVVIVKGDFRG